MIEFPWNEDIKLEDGHFASFRIGTLILLIAKLGREWHVASSRSNKLAPGFPEDLAPSGLAKNLPSNLSWNRFDGASENATFRLRPALADLPVVARLATPITIPSDARSKFFIGIPTLVEIVAQCEGRPTTLHCISSEVLSYTWRGNIRDNGGISSTEGQVCYSLPSSARREYAEEKVSPHSIICMVEVINKSLHPISFSRICIDTSHMSIFQGKRRFWTNSCRIPITGDARFEGLVYLPAPPKEAISPIQICPPRLGSVRRILYPSVLNLTNNPPQIAQ